MGVQVQAGTGLGSELTFTVRDGVGIRVGVGVEVRGKSQI